MPALRPSPSAPAALCVAALACVAAPGCFRDDAPALECTAGPIGPCEAVTTTTTGASSSTTTGEPETTGEPTTGAPVDPSRTFRIDALELVDPHFFIEPCADATDFVNEVLLQGNINTGKFNLLFDFPNYDPEALAPALVEAEDCDLNALTCVRKDGLSLTITAERVEEGACVTLDPAVLSVPSAPLVSAPQPPCVRTAQAELAFPIEGAAVPLNLRDAQVVFNLDDLADPQALQNGVVYGFLTRASAEATTVNVNGVMFVLWELIIGPVNCAMFPEYLPSTETINDGGEIIEGVWLVFNFTAVRVDLVKEL